MRLQAHGLYSSRNSSCARDDSQLIHTIHIQTVHATPCWYDVIRSQRSGKVNLQIWLYEAWQLAARDGRSSITQRRHSSFQKKVSSRQTPRRFLPRCVYQTNFRSTYFFWTATLTRPRPSRPHWICSGTVLVAAVRALSLAAYCTVRTVKRVCRGWMRGPSV
jgi:hypothetical protein